MKMHSLTPVATALAVLTLAACDSLSGSVTDGGSTTSNGVVTDELTTVQDLAAELEDSDHVVVTGETMNEPVFGVNGTQLTVDGQQVQVFEFASEDAAQQATEDISEDGSTIGTAQVDWISQPHFYQDGNLVVLYVGTDEMMLDALEEALGAQIAGGEGESSSAMSDSSSTSGAMMDL